MTEQAKALGLTAELNDMCRVVYKKDKNSDGYVFHSLWHPEGEYTEEHIILPVGSTYNGISEKFEEGTTFANVSGSTGDPKCPSIDPENPKSKVGWMELMRQAFKNAGENYDLDSCCAERDKIYKSDDDNEVNDFNCTDGGTGTMQGGHVLIGAKKSVVLIKGSEVYLLPICIAHNTSRKLGDSGTGYYMKLERAMKAVKLKGYLNDPEN